jgi:hypothetical protein
LESVTRPRSRSVTAIDQLPATSSSSSQKPSTPPKTLLKTASSISDINEETTPKQLINELVTRSPRQAEQDIREREASEERQIRRTTPRQLNFGAEGEPVRASREEEEVEEVMERQFIPLNRTTGVLEMFYGRLSGAATPVVPNTPGWRYLRSGERLHRTNPFLGDMRNQERVQQAFFDALEERAAQTISTFRRFQPDPEEEEEEEGIPAREDRSLQVSMGADSHSEGDNLSGARGGGGESLSPDSLAKFLGGGGGGEKERQLESSPVLIKFDQPSQREDLTTLLQNPEDLSAQMRTMTMEAAKIPLPVTAPTTPGEQQQQALGRTGRPSSAGQAQQEEEEEEEEEDPFDRPLPGYPDRHQQASARTYPPRRPETRSQGPPSPPPPGSVDKLGYVYVPRKPKK